MHRIAGFGHVRVTRVERVALDDLDDRDARSDGFDSAAALREELDAIYTDKIASGYLAFRVVLKPEAPVEPAAVKTP